MSAPFLPDPPVGIFSTVEEIRAWMAKLDELEVKHATNAGALEVIRLAREQADKWLRYAQELEM